MKIECPTCHAGYRVADDKVAHGVMNAVCKRCGAKMTIDGKSGAALLQGQDREDGQERASVSPSFQDTGPSTPEKGEGVYSIASLSSKYPRYRDAFIVLGLVLVFAGILGGVHWAVKGTERSISDFIENPVGYIVSLVMDSETHTLCQAFVRQNERQFASLGRDLTFVSLEEDMRIVNGKKISRVVGIIQGSKASQNIAFRLQASDGTWEIIDVVLDLGQGKRKRLYP